MTRQTKTTGKQDVCKEVILTASDQKWNTDKSLLIVDIFWSAFVIEKIVTSSIESTNIM